MAKNGDRKRPLAEAEKLIESLGIDGLKNWIQDTCRNGHYQVLPDVKVARFSEGVVDESFIEETKEAEKNLKGSWVTSIYKVDSHPIVEFAKVAGRYLAVNKGGYWGVPSRFTKTGEQRIGLEEAVMNSRNGVPVNSLGWVVIPRDGKALQRSDGSINGIVGLSYEEGVKNICEQGADAVAQRFKDKKELRLAPVTELSKYICEGYQALSEAMRVMIKPEDYRQGVFNAIKARV